MKERTPQKQAAPVTTEDSGFGWEGLDFGSNAAQQEAVEGETESSSPSLLDWLLGGFSPDEAVQAAGEKAGELASGVGEVVTAGVGGAAALANGGLDSAERLVTGLKDAGTEVVAQGTSAIQAVGGAAQEGAAKLVGAVEEAVYGPLDLVVDKGPAAKKDIARAWGNAFEIVLEAWGNTFHNDAVRLESDTIILRWNPTWGPTPTQKSLGGSERPVDAKAGVGAMHRLGGWNTVPDADRVTLDALIGGETSSRSEATRSKLRGDFTAVKAMSAADQATRLTGLITSADKPFTAEESTEKLVAAPYTLAGPTAKAGHAFRGATVDAEVWVVNFTDTAGGSVEIIAPKDPFAAGVLQHTVKEAADSVAIMPPASRKVTKSISLNPVTNPDDPYWAGQYNMPGFHSYMTAGAAGEITVYPGSVKQTDNVMKTSVLHETGHTWSYRQWGKSSADAKWQPWKDAMASDRTSVSKYADASVDEDVAETVSVYGSTYGSPAYDEYAAMVPARFAILDKEMGHK